MRKADARGFSLLAEIKPLLAEVLHRLQERFAEGLLAVILYGSYARGEAEVGSDADLLVAVRRLPPEWTDVFALENELVLMGQELGIRLDIRLVEPEAVSYSVTWAAPLMLEVYDAHCILFDPSGFFAAEMERFAEVARERGICKVARGVWRVPTVCSSVNRSQEPSSGRHRVT
jgi:predicted nucleotidyltransferase